MSSECYSLFSLVRAELPRCARHKDASHIDCVECMYLSSKLYAPLEEIESAFRRAVLISEHLMQMIPRETWRASGGDDGQGHYEGDYREASTFEEIQSWKAMFSE